jgi:hypothetical protein
MAGTAFWGIRDGRSGGALRGIIDDAFEEEEEEEFATKAVRLGDDREVVRGGWEWLATAVGGAGAGRVGGEWLGMGR